MRLQPGSRKQARCEQARFYSQSPGNAAKARIVDPRGATSPIPRRTPFTRCFTKAGVPGQAQPVNEYLRDRCTSAAPSSPLVERGYLRLSTAVLRSALPELSPQIVDVTLPGRTTHDLIVWGPPGPSTIGGFAANDPLLNQRHHQRALAA